MCLFAMFFTYPSVDAQHRAPKEMKIHTAKCIIRAVYIISLCVYVQCATELLTFLSDAGAFGKILSPHLIRHMYYI